ncbi:hypothetical protein MULP_00966 [Mycobacterium liflandii 128FXT]|uniref:Uncharacterized protein n=1 Tax=Mycobacterium liflandii (strain 128FXT) TaxID=459424 RepID=L7V394_MYCL1|nr:hypothetical protein MULP_00966 [Mycobacterium liflandii 128FXT]RFZ55780.1 hypothetical protein BB170200_03801 [Mycobacterium marinum]
MALQAKIGVALEDGKSAQRGQNPAARWRKRQLGHKGHSSP